MKNKHETVSYQNSNIQDTIATTNIAKCSVCGIWTLEMNVPHDVDD